MDLRLTLCGGAIKKEEIFDSYIYKTGDSYEAKTIFLSGRGLPLRGGGGDNAQAQLILDVYPSQDNPTNQTLWIFSGSSTTYRFSNLRTSGFDSRRDSWQVPLPGNIYNANKPSNQTISLSPLFSSSNSKDIASVRARIPGGGRTNITFAAGATNTPTITVGSGNRTIANLFMSEATRDIMGIRVSGSSLSYSSGNSSAWVGSGILNKPIGDFFAGTFNNVGDGNSGGPWFAANNNGSVQVIVNSQIIPEPEEYALVFGLFALGFVFFRRHWQKKQRRQQTATS